MNRAQAVFAGSISTILPSMSTRSETVPSSKASATTLRTSSTRDRSATTKRVGQPPAVIASATAEVEVTKVGFERIVANRAEDSAFYYGLFAVALSLLTQRRRHQKELAKAKLELPDNVEPVWIEEVAKSMTRG